MYRLHPQMFGYVQPSLGMCTHAFNSRRLDCFTCAVLPTQSGGSNSPVHQHTWALWEYPGPTEMKNITQHVIMHLTNLFDKGYKQHNLITLLMYQTLNLF